MPVGKFSSLPPMKLDGRCLCGILVYRGSSANMVRIRVTVLLEVDQGYNREGWNTPKLAIYKQKLPHTQNDLKEP